MGKTGTRHLLIGFILPVLLGCLLLTTAALKADQLRSLLPWEEGGLNSRWIMVPQIACELILGMWLISQMNSQVCRKVALGVFTVFAIVSLGKGLKGEISCGCFGHLQVNPWWTFALDLFALAALWWWRPKSLPQSHASTYQFRLATMCVTFLIFGGPALYLMLDSQPLGPTGDGIVNVDGVFVILEPEKWVGKPLPIVSQIDIGERLMDGTWTLVLYHHGCPKCQEALPKYERAAAIFSSQGTSTAVVEVPPYGSPKSESTANLLHGRLNEKREWFTQLPVEMILENGVVKRASTDLASIEGI